MTDFTQEELAALRADPQTAVLLQELEKVETTVADLRNQNGYDFLEIDWRRHPHPKQQDYFRSIKPKKAMFGAQGSGKSTVLIAEAVGLATHRHPTLDIPAPVDLWIVALNYKKVEQVLLPILKRMLPAGQIKRWDSQDYIMELHNGNTITFMSAESGPDKFQSNRLDWIGFDEAPQKGAGVAIYKECLSRFKPGRILYLRMAATPWEMPRFFRDEFYLGAQTNKAEVDCITVGLKDNPYITPDQLKYQAKQYVGKEYKARILGEPVDLSGLVFDTISPKHLIPDFPIPARWPRFRGIDPTEGRRPWSIIWATISPQGKLYIYREMEVAGRLSQIVNAIRAASEGERIEWTAIDPFASKHEVMTGNPWTTELADLGLDTTTVDRSKRSWYRTQMSTRLGDPDAGIDPDMYFFEIGAEKTYKSVCNHNWQDWATGNEYRAAKETEEDSKWKDFVDAVLYMISQNPEYYEVDNYVASFEDDRGSFEPIDEMVGY